MGTPQKVASTICLNLEPGSEKNGEFTESGFQDERFEEKATPAARSSRTKEGDTYSYNEALESRIIIVLMITWDRGRNHGRARR